MGVVLPEDGFLEMLRDITQDNGSLLIFDEVINGFRVSPGGAQKLYGIDPDITCLGKIIGGGLPVGAFGGKKEVMERMAPEGDIYQAGTLSGNPLAMAAGLATLKALNAGNVYQQLEEKGRLFFSGLKEAAESANVDLVVNRVGSMGSIFFSDKPVTDFSSAKNSDSAKFVKYYLNMLDQKIYLAPSPFEASFVSTAHDDHVIKKTIQCAELSFKNL